jgi:hypothetical protein
MTALHAQDILHLDLKPGNVLVSEHGVPWVADFGLAKHMSGTLASSIGSSKSGRGTLQYKAPELFRPRKRGGALYHKPCDMYSFAMVTWETFTGEIPFKGVSENEISTMHIMAVLGQDDPERPPLEDPKVPARVRPLVQACWAQDHATRPTFERALQRIRNIPPLPTTSRVGDLSSPAAASFSDPAALSLRAIAEHLNRIEGIAVDLKGGQRQILESLEAGFATLAARIGDCMQLMINLPRSNIPYFFFCVPADDDKQDQAKKLQDAKKAAAIAAKYAGKVAKIKRTFMGLSKMISELPTKMKRKSGWSVWVHLYMWDEAPLLPLPEGQAPIERSETPPHKPIVFELPGPTLVKMSPMLAVFSKLLLVANKFGKVAGMPIPKEIPGLLGGEAAGARLKEVASYFEEVAKLGKKMDSVGKIVKGLENTLSAGKKTVKVLKKVQEDMHDSYDALNALLTKTDGQAAKQWQKIVDSGAMVKVGAKEGGSIHWVSKRNVRALVESGMYVVCRHESMRAAPSGVAGSNGGGEAKTTSPADAPVEAGMRSDRLEIRVSRWRVEGQAKKYAVYELRVTCPGKWPALGGEYCVWRRYSDLLALHKGMPPEKVGALSFPPKKNQLVVGKGGMLRMLPVMPATLPSRFFGATRSSSEKTARIGLSFGPALDESFLWRRCAAFDEYFVRLAVEHGNAPFVRLAAFLEQGAEEARERRRQAAAEKAAAEHGVVKPRIEQ